jgi:beta-phosphoglucomutase-like phosphatase (HAD superfamily)
MANDETAAQPAAKKRPLLKTADFDAVVFDLDGVITHTRKVHAAAWNDVFNDFLREYGAAHALELAPFDVVSDYVTYLDGRPRHEGVRAFLAARGIDLPVGQPTDPDTAETCYGIGNRKETYLRKWLDDIGVEVFRSAVELVHRLRWLGKSVGMVTATSHADRILELGKIAGVFQVQIDGVEAARHNLAPRPAPDAHKRAAEILGTTPQKLAVFEDTISGIEAAKSAGCGLVVGVDRRGNTNELLDAGADFVVEDLSRVQVV